MTLASVTLDDKYTRSGRVFLTGTQALVRLPMIQRQRDLARGLNTAGFISGYRGSPLGGYDQALWRAQRFLDQSHIRFQPGVNEELAADAVWGSQQVGLFPGATYDGVFGIWYGKGPGLDRALDAIKHAHSAGTARHGGVLAIAGDDHGASSSTLAHQSDHNFLAASVPVLNPAGVQDYVDFGLWGFALSRFAGLWVGFTAVADTVESTASILIDPERVQVFVPEDFALPPGGLNIRWPDSPLDQEARLHNIKLPAALAFARRNPIDRTIVRGRNARLGIVTTGKAYLDVRQALDNLGLDEGAAAAVGIAVYKVGMSWPLEPTGLLRFAEGLDEILVVEEKRPFLEDQVKAHLYRLPADRRPRVTGKVDDDGHVLLCTAGLLTPSAVARLIVDRVGNYHDSPQLSGRLAYLNAKEASLAGKPADVVRIPFFCSGCPHNSSTKVPEGSRALAGIGCHYMAIWMNRDTATFSQMGGEGAAWVGQAPFTTTPHVFANLGDGTYYHSGSLAIRQAVMAHANITYKILFNDAVAMTGGQPVDGNLTVVAVAAQVRAEGVGRIAVVSDEPEKYSGPAAFPHGTTIHHRDELDSLQKELRATPGVSVMIYDQTCAAEKRRRRKRGTYPDPQKRVFINEAVCEGCGDCSVQSNCLSILPLDTEFGRKREIDQSSCNKDYSCVNGFCPSFVTVEGGHIQKARADTRTLEAAVASLPMPKLPPLTQPFGVLVTGVGGTGVITIGAILGMAAHVEGKGCTVLDQTGLAQKGGAVMSHVRIAPKPEDLHAVRIDTGGANLVLAADMVVAARPDAIAMIDKGRARVIANSHQIPTAAFTLDTRADIGTDRLRARLVEAAGRDGTEFFDATGMATALFGDSIATNMFLLGYAWQRGTIPVSFDALIAAIRINAVAVDANIRTLQLGRLAAERPELIAEATARREPARIRNEDLTLDDLITRRAAVLADYQNAAYAARYRALVARVREAEQRVAQGSERLTRAVALNAHKLMAYKDEYEVARLYTGGDFRARLRQQFGGDFRLKFHLAPPLITKPDPVTGKVAKRTFGPWMMSVFRLLAGLRHLRGTPLDPFGYLAERRQERRLRDDYEALMHHVCDGLSAANLNTAVELASLPDDIRGYGHIKHAAVAAVKKREQDLRRAFGQPAPAAQAAE